MIVLPATYQPIEAITVSGTSTSSSTFSNIPGFYTDLVLISVGGANSTAFDAWVRFNGDTGSNYSLTSMSGTGSGSGTSQRESNATFIRIDKQAAWRSGNRTMNIVHIMDYSNTTTNKTLLSRASASTDAVDAIVGLWRNTAAITSITVSNDATAAFADGTTFTLYGVKAG